MAIHQSASASITIFLLLLFILPSRSSSLFCLFALLSLFNFPFFSLIFSPCVEFSTKVCPVFTSFKCTGLYYTVTSRQKKSLKSGVLYLVFPGITFLASTLYSSFVSLHPFRRRNIPLLTFLSGKNTFCLTVDRVRIDISSFNTCLRPTLTLSFFFLSLSHTRLISTHLLQSYLPL